MPEHLDSRRPRYNSREMRVGRVSRLPLFWRVFAVNAGLLGWRVLMRFWFTTSAYGLGEGLRSIPRLIVGNVIAMLAAARALSIHLRGGAKRWDKTRHIFPAELPQ